MDDKVSIGVEFPIDNARARAETSETKQIIRGVGETAESTAKRVSDRMSQSTSAYQEQIGLIEKQKERLKELNDLKSKSNDVYAIARYNQRLEETNEKLAKLNRAGKSGFDVFGNKEAIALEKPIGKLERLIYLQKLYAKTAAESANPEIISKYNRKLQETETAINQTKNVGKKGFDEMGNAIKGSTNVLGKAFSGLRLIANILPGIGLAGLLAFAVGPIIEFVSKLDIFGLKLSNLKQAQKDLAEQMGNAGDAAGKATIEIDLQKQAFEQARKGVITKTEALKLYNDKIGKTLGFTNDINVAEERTIKNGNAYIELMFKKAKAAALLSLYQEQIAAQAKIDAKSDDDAAGYLQSGLKNGGAAEQALFKKVAQDSREREKKPFVEKAEAFKKLILDTDNDIKEFAKQHQLSVDELIKPKTKDTTSKVERITGVTNLPGRDVMAQLLSATDELTEQQKKKDAKKYDELLKDFMTYAEKRLAIQQKYIGIEAKFIANGDAENAKVAREKREEETAALDVANVQKWDSYKELFDNIETGSKAQTEKAIAEFEAQLDAAEIYGDARLAIEKKITELRSKVANKSNDGLKDSAEQLSRIAQQFTSINAGFSEVANTLANSVSSLAEARLGISNFQEAQKNKELLGQISSGLGIAGAAFGIVNGINSLFNKADKERQVQASYAAELQLKQYNAMNKVLERQVKLIKDVWGTDQVKAYSDAVKTAQDNESEYLKALDGRVALTGDAKKDDVIKKYNAGARSRKNYTAGSYEWNITNAINSGDIGQRFDFAKMSTDELQKLIDFGKLDSDSLQLVQNLIDAKQSVIDLGKQMKESFTGSTLSDVSDFIVDAITSGADAGGKNFEEIIRKYMTKSLQSAELNKEIAKFYENFNKAAEDGLQQGETEKLKAEYDKIIAENRKKAEDLQKVTGVSFTDSNQNTSSPNSLKGAYSTASQESIELLAGQTSGMRIAQLETNNINRDGFAKIHQSGAEQLAMLRTQHLTQLEIAANTLRTANNTDKLASIEISLKSIDTNISKNANALAGSGKGP